LPAPEIKQFWNAGKNMFWKESLRIGVDIIDEQHKELFAKTRELLKEINGHSADKKQKCISTILFLKDYAVKQLKLSKHITKNLMIHLLLKWG